MFSFPALFFAFVHVVSVCSFTRSEAELIEGDNTFECGLLYDFYSH